MPLSEHCEKSIRLSPNWEASRGPYDLRENPYWRDILDAMTDPEVKEISVLKSTRVGGTLLLVAACIGLSKLDPGPAMIVTPDEVSCIELRDRIYDTCTESPEHSHRVPSKRLWNTRAIDLLSNAVRMAWAGSAQRLRGRTCRRVFLSEIDVYPPANRGGGDPVRAAQERTKRSYYSLKYYESSPDGEDSAIHKLHAQGNQMVWQCPCPQCGAYQELRFFPHTTGPHKGNGGVVGFKDEHGNHLSEDEALLSAYYRCINGCRIENHEKNDMVEKGVWVAKGQHVNNETGELEGTPERSRRHISIHLWTVHVPTISFSEIARGYISHYNTNDLKEFHQNWLGRRWRTGRKVPSWDAIGRRYQSYYARGELPIKTYFVTAGVDVQLHGCYWSVWGWQHACKPTLIDWGYNRRFLSDADELNDDEIEDLTFSNIASDLAQLDTCLVHRRFPVFGNQKSVHGHPEMRLLGIAMDANFRDNSVHRYVQQRKDKRIIAVRGDHHTSSKDRFRKSVVEKASDGHKYEQSRTVWNVATQHFKLEAYDRFALEPTAVQAFEWPQSMHQRGADFLRQMLNETWVEEVDRKTGKKAKGHFKEKNNKLGSHYLDTYVYARVRAEIILAQLNMTWDSNTWLKESRVPANPTQHVLRQHQLKT
jgi:phage terminase large subunit GpA-like protein